MIHEAYHVKVPEKLLWLLENRKKIRCSRGTHPGFSSTRVLNPSKKSEMEGKIGGGGGAADDLDENGRHPHLKWQLRGLKIGGGGGM